MKNGMTVKIDKGNLIISMPVQKPYLSKSGKSQIVATTGGFFTSEAEVQGKPVKVAVNAVIQ